MCRNMVFGHPSAATSPNACGSQVVACVEPYRRATPRKSHTDLKQHMEDVKTALSIMVTALSHINPLAKEIPGSKFPYAIADLKKAVERHDMDKLLAVGDHAYDAHDLRAKHHVACWVADGGHITVVGFLEHLIDHMAVNKARSGSFFIDVPFLDPDRLFERDDLGLYFNLDSKWVQIAIANAKEQYRALVRMVLTSPAANYLPLRS